MSASNSPFLIVQNFISPNMCEQIVDAIKVDTPNLDVKGDPQKLERRHFMFDAEIAERWRELVPDIEARYKCHYNGLEKPIFQHYPANPKAPAEPPGCENSRYIRKKWVQHKDVDLVGFIWLKDYTETVPIDPRYEIYGGRLEFPAYNFSLVPQRGTLVVFPAGPHFITVTSPVFVGDLYQIKLNASIKNKDDGQWLYQPQNHPGTWQDWLNEFL